MSDVIHRLLEVEKRARRVIEEAEQDAGRIVERAREEARRIVADCREEARREAEDLVAQQVQQWQQRKEEGLQKEREQLPSVDDMDGGKVAKAVEFIVRTVAPGLPE